MKRSIRSLLSLFLCASLLIGFSSIASADEVEVKPYGLTQVNRLQYYWFGEYYYKALGSPNIFTFYPNNGTVEKQEQNVVNPTHTDGSSLTMYALLKESKISSAFSLFYTDQSIILNAEKSYKVRLNNVYHSVLIANSLGEEYIRDFTELKIGVYYVDNTSEFFTSYKVEHVENTPIYHIEFDVTPTKDVKQIMFEISSRISDELPSTMVGSGSGLPGFTSYYGETNGDDKYQFSLEVSSEESGLLKSLIEWVKGIKDVVDNIVTFVFDGFSSVINRLGEMMNTLLELPSKIWNFIENGLKSLFVPSEEKTTEYKEKWDTLLSSRFGAIYQVGNIITDYVGAITETDRTNVIKMPSVSLDSVGIPFSFGGYDVQIVPEGFGLIVEVCKKIVSIACTFLFVNGLRKRYDEVIRGNSA